MSAPVSREHKLFLVVCRVVGVMWLLLLLWYVVDRIAFVVEMAEGNEGRRAGPSRESSARATAT